jgi:predicted secreted protein
MNVGVGVGSMMDRLRRRSRTLAAAVALLGALLAAPWALAPAVAGPVLSLDAQARAAVANDEMVVTLAIERDGAQVGALNDAVLSQLNAAIAEARGVEGVKARLGSIWTQPNYTRDGKAQGWRVRGEVVLESTRMAAVAQLGARLGERMQLSGVQFRLSAERRQAEERRLIAEAARAFRARAAEAATAFGFAGYELKEIALRSGGGSPGPRPMAAMARGAVAADAAPLPTEGGESDVVVGVSGSVELRP